MLAVLAVSTGTDIDVRDTEGSADKAAKASEQAERGCKVAVTASSCPAFGGVPSDKLPRPHATKQAKSWKRDPMN